MSLRNIHLRKLLKIMYLPLNRRVSALRSDIREELARERGGDGAGGDFYSPFWSDAKRHVFFDADLNDATRGRIAANSGRSNLYPQLRDGFLLWWNDRRRWTNEPFRPAEPIKSSYGFPNLGATVKLANILCVRDARDTDHFVYPYWFPVPAIVDESARLGLWLLHQTFPAIDPTELRMLDVIKGATFSLDRTPLVGNEAQVFVTRYAALLHEWDTLREEYD